MRAYLGHGDFNGDGHLDLAALGGTIDPESAKIDLYVDFFMGPFDIPGPSPNPKARLQVPDEPFGVPFNPTTADVDADGYDDLVFGHWDVAYVIYGQGR